ncbi:MAG: hypothetical protein AABX30_00395 [Nanoarchaeota archaeon]
MEKKGVLLIVFLVLFAFFFITANYTDLWNITGNPIFSNRGGLEGPPAPETIGPSLEEQTCMMQCMGCSSPGVGCTGNQEQCTTQCNVKKPEITDDTRCMEECVVRGCGKFDFDCQQKNKNSCEKECDMIKEPEAKSEEEQCIKDCVNKEDPGLICKPGEGGEKGNEICQTCAKSCEYLYDGPCLIESELDQKKKDCQTCEYCYGEPVMGDSGEGYDCIVDIKCGDASAEFGDDPGTGEGIGNAIGNFFEGIGNFFKNIFGGGEESSGGESSGESNPVGSSE